MLGLFRSRPLLRPVLPLVGDAARAVMSEKIALHYCRQIEARKADVLARISTLIGRGYTLLALSLSLAGGALAWLRSGGGWAAAVGLGVCGVVMGLLLLKVTTRHGHWGAGSHLRELGVNEFVPYYLTARGFSSGHAYVQILCDHMDMLTADIDASLEQLSAMLWWYLLCLRLYLLALPVVGLLWWVG
mgnify:CR=1 FL=1